MHVSNGKPKATVQARILLSNQVIEERGFGRDSPLAVIYNLKSLILPNSYTNTQS